MKEFIYALHTDGRVFYVGKTQNPDRRLAEHIRNAANNSPEMKYQHIRKLTAKNISWEMLILEEVDASNDRYEMYHMYIMIMDGHVLTNQRMGDAKQQADFDAMDRLRGKRSQFNSAKEFLSALEQEKAEAKARIASEKLNAKLRKEEIKDKYYDETKTKFAGESKKEFEERTMSPALRAMKERQAAAKLKK